MSPAEEARVACGNALLRLPKWACVVAGGDSQFFQTEDVPRATKSVCTLGS
jgi:hypothetical protein